MKWRYLVIGETFSYSLFLLLKNGWIQEYEYCESKKDTGQEFSYKVFHLDGMKLLRKTLLYCILTRMKTEKMINRVKLKYIKFKKLIFINILFYMDFLSY